MNNIECQCSNCGKRILISNHHGASEAMYEGGYRATGAFYCAECVRTWKDRNGKEFDEQYKNPRKMFEDWWNDTVDRQCKEENGDIVEELERAKSVIKDLMTDRYGSKCEFCIQDNNPDARCRKYSPGSGEWCCDNAAWNGKVFEEL